MKKIDPKEDQFIKLAIDMGMRFYEGLFTSTDATDEMNQIGKLMEMEIHLISDDLLQMSQEDRTKEEISLSVTNAMDRVNEKYNIDATIMKILIETWTNTFEFLMKMLSLNKTT